MNWVALGERAEERYRDGLERLPGEPDARQRQLTRTGNAAWAAGLCLLMEGRADEARAWLVRAAERYRESFADAPPGSWGRLIGALKALLLAGDGDGAIEAARWSLAQGPGCSDSPIGRYAAALALLVLGDDAEAARLVATLRAEPAEAFPRPVADALAALAARDRALYEDALARTLASFEVRDAYLEDVPVADTVSVLEELAAPRGLAVRPCSPLLPAIPRSGSSRT